MSLPLTVLAIGIADAALIAGLAYVMAMPMRLLPHRAAHDEPADRDVPSWADQLV